ncbi:MAG: DUF1360 domain-containing protein [Candidatus Pacebacteria bacterium]|nr:DUF1360 domain-containing protein [Candidatus Paceibacterota bacterium]MBP9840659.1 DUF1360 domain-containing protein [Candidatus Paceibacterota bacterium]
MRLPVWNIFFSVLFAAIVLWGAAWLSVEGLLPEVVPAGDFILMSLAIFRLTRLVTYDHITDFVRDWLKSHDETTFWGTLGKLMACPWCTGLWFAFFVPFFYMWQPLAWFVVLVLALAALATFMQILANWVGWSAETKKRESQSLPLPR